MSIHDDRLLAANPELRRQTDRLVALAAKETFVAAQKRGQARYLFEKGLSTRYIGWLAGVSHVTILAWIEKEEEANVDRRVDI